MKYEKVKKWGKLLFGTAVLCLFCHIFSLTGGCSVYAYASPYSQEEGNEIRMEVIWNEDGALRVGGTLPITVQVTAPEAVDGTVSVQVYLENEEYYTLEEAISLSAGEARQVDFRLPVTYGSTNMRVVFTGTDGTLYGEDSIALNPSYNYSDLYIGAVTDYPPHFYWHRAITMDQYDMNIRMSYLTAEEVPELVSLFDYYDILFLDGVKEEQWTDAQEEAIRQWVQAGGILVVGNDSDFCESVRPGELIRENSGMGEYVYCGFSLDSLDSLLTEESDGELFFQNCLGTYQWEQLTDRISYGDSGYWEAYSLTPAADAGRIPHVLWYVLALIIYLMLIGPILYFRLKRKKMQHMLRFSMAGISILFTFIIYLMGSRTRYTSPFATYVSICRLSENQMQERIYLNIQSPYHTQYTAELADGYDVAYLTDSMSGMIQVDWTQSSPRVRMIRTGQEISLQIHDTVPFTSEYFQLTRVSGETEGKLLDGALTVSPEAVDGTLTNHTGMDLVRVSIWTENRWIYVGDLPDGASVQLAEAETASARYVYRPELFEKTVGSDGYTSAVDSEEAAAAFWRQRILEYDLGYVRPAEGSAVVYAFLADEDRELVKDDPVIVSGITVICTELPVDYVKGDLTYIPDMKEQTTGLSGDFDSFFVIAYEQTVELLYSFGEYELETLYVEWPEAEKLADYIKGFEGTMEFYCVATQSYEEVEQKDCYDRSELLPYLDEENSIRVRWTNDGFDEYTMELLLPIFSYTGRQIS